MIKEIQEVDLLDAMGYEEIQTVWTSGLNTLAPVYAYSNRLARYSTERAAWMGREYLIAQRPDLYSPGGYPEEQTIERAIQRALERGRSCVVVVDETLAIVREIPV